MDDKLKAYAGSLYEQSLYESAQILRDEQVNYLRQMAMRQQTVGLPPSGPEIQGMTKLHVQHIERCMHAKLESYRKAFNEAGATPSDEQFREILRDIEDAQKLQIIHSCRALQQFMKSRGRDADPTADLTSGSGHGHDRVLREWKVWHAQSQVRKAARSDDREFARMALEEARKSVAEEDGRVHPKVGAVVVKDGRVLSAAHRGESPGCHAEYVALEMKAADTPLAGATVYTTLEPCTTRNHPKVPCALRLVERRVARVVIGMLDPNPAISGKGLRALRKGRIVTELFPHDLMDEVEELNREFTRIHEAQGGGTQQGRALETQAQLLPASRPEVVITGWGPNKNPERPEYRAQHGFYLHNSGLETALRVRVCEFQIPFEIADAWISGEAPFIDRTKDGFIPVHRKLGGRPNRWDLEAFLIEAYKDKGPGNKTIPITVQYRDPQRGYLTHQDLVFSPELKRIVSFGAPREELDSASPQ